MIRHIGKYRGKTIVFQPTRGRDGPRRQPGDQAGRPEPGRQRARLHGAGRHAADRRRATADGMAEMVFADNGCGMSPDVLENIFEPFFTKRRDGKGTGPGPVDHAPDRQPAPRRDHGRRARARARARRSRSGCRSTRPRSPASGRDGREPARRGRGRAAAPRDPGGSTRSRIRHGLGPAVGTRPGPSRDLREEIG